MTKASLRCTDEMESLAVAAGVLRRRGKLRERFERLVSQWKYERDAFTSDATQWAMCMPYQKIIAIGPEVVPLILAEMRREPDQWFWALCVLTDENPVKPEHSGNFYKMSQDWIKWGETRGLLAPQVSKPVPQENKRKLKLRRKHDPLEESRQRSPQARHDEQDGGGLCGSP